MKYLEAEGMHNPLVAAEAHEAAASAARRGVLDCARTPFRGALDELALLSAITTTYSDAVSAPFHSACALLLDYAPLRQRKHSPRR